MVCNVCNNLVNVSGIDNRTFEYRFMVLIKRTKVTVSCIPNFAITYYLWGKCNVNKCFRLWLIGKQMISGGRSRNMNSKGKRTAAKTATGHDSVTGKC